MYGSEIEVDYRGYEVSVENFIRVLTGLLTPNHPRLSVSHALAHSLTHARTPSEGRHHEGVPRSKRLMTDERSNVLIYMTGHGGDEFLKFQDFEEICSRFAPPL
jgi:phosphatidylinositol glycan class K